MPIFKCKLYRWYETESISSSDSDIFFADIINVNDFQNKILIKRAQKYCFGYEKLIFLHILYSTKSYTTGNMYRNRYTKKCSMITAQVKRNEN